MFYKLAIVALATFALFAGQANGAALVADNDGAIVFGIVPLMI